MGIVAGPGALNPLDDVRRRLEAVLNNATVAIFLMDDRQHCIYMNRAAEKLTGYDFEEILALDRPLHDIIHHQYPDGRPFPLSECAIDRAFPEHHQMQGEETFVHRDGSFYPVAFTASPIKDAESHTVGTIIEVRDIAAEKQAEERQRLLLKELDHRVKNMLATVQALAWRTFRDLDADAVERFNERLAALSRAHAVLTGSAWTGTSLADIVGAAVDVFGRDRFRFDGPDCDIDARAAATLSMVLHELGTNATKYGALSTASGEVHLRWQCDRGEDGTAVEIQWEERGGPPVSPPTRKGFGTRLIERQVALELGGRADLDFLPEGLHCTIHLRSAGPAGLAAHPAAGTV